MATITAPALVIQGADDILFLQARVARARLFAIDMISPNAFLDRLRYLFYRASWNWRDCVILVLHISLALVATWPIAKLSLHGDTR